MVLCQVLEVELNGACMNMKKSTYNLILIAKVRVVIGFNELI